MKEIASIRLYINKWKLFSLYIFLILITSCKTKIFLNVRSPNNYYGKIKLVIAGKDLNYYKLDSGMINSDFKTYTCFDTNGNIITETTYYSDGSLQDSVYIEYKYNNNRKIEEVIRYHFSGSGYGYVLKYINKYNKDELIENHLCYSDNKFQSEYIYIYNKNNRPKEMITFSSDSSLYLRIEYKHNKKGQLTEAIEYFEDSTISRKLLFNYYKNRLKKEEKWYEYDSLEFILNYRYYYKNRTFISNAYKPDGTAYYEYIATYDKSGNVILEKHNYYDSTSYSLKYQYDKYGNWITKEYEKNGRIEISKRKIEYY